MQRVLIVLLMSFVASLGMKSVASSKAAELSRVFKPNIPVAKGEACVRETAFMRTDHMSLLLHQRDQTVYKGMRPKRISFNACLTCHVVLGSDARAVTYKDPKHFCRTCHDYAAVSIDCFSCHNSVPELSETARK